MTQRITPETLTAIRQRAESATPGPWFPYYEYDGEARVLSHNEYHTVDIAEKLNDRDAKIISEARQDIPLLLAEIEYMNGVVGALVSNLELIAERTDGQAKEIAEEAIKYGAENLE